MNRRPVLRRCGLVAIGFAFILLSSSACSNRDRQTYTFGPPSKNEFSVMSFNLRQFRYADRDRDGQEDDFKPEEEIVPLLGLIADARPDVLAVQELGDASTALYLQKRLREAGVDYAHLDHLAGPNPHATLGILSRLPIVYSEPLTNLFYSIQGRSHIVQRGFQQVDIQVNPAFKVRIINVHLKSKVFHESGQTEMRRNESRLLATHVRRLLKEQPDIHLLVCGDLNDAFNSAAVRELLDRENTLLQDLKLTDRDGDIWTHYFQRDQIYSRIDYMLVNPGMKKKWVVEKSGIVRDHRTYAASDHRPIFATFTVTD